LVTAIDGTMLCCPDSTANLRVYRHGNGGNCGTGYRVTESGCQTLTVGQPGGVWKSIGQNKEVPLAGRPDLVDGQAAGSRHLGAHERDRFSAELDGVGDQVVAAADRMCTPRS